MILLISGSLRVGSNAAALRTVHELVPGSVLFDGLAMLPHFNPDDDAEPLHPAVAALRSAIAAADAVLFCTPEYAGALPGSFKNLLDWTIGGGEIYQKPVAWINVSVRGAEAAHASLRTVLGYAGTRIVEDAVAHIPLPPESMSGGLVTDPELRARIADVVAKLVPA
ncbi:NADPH-dependent FMN reductase [Amycolatopsis sp. NPDC059657]|uniref:NADPH-dependent FMN reductase n=1 Tax=Amycolatopsis sp. NPDC059657 TaxID=3346899 RepID=UPI00366FF86C